MVTEENTFRSEEPDTLRVHGVGLLHLLCTFDISH